MFWRFFFRLIGHYYVEWTYINIRYMNIDDCWWHIDVMMLPPVWWIQVWCLSVWESTSEYFEWVYYKYRPINSLVPKKCITKLKLVTNKKTNCILILLFLPHCLSILLFASNHKSIMIDLSRSYKSVKSVKSVKCTIYSESNCEMFPLLNWLCIYLYSYSSI